MIKSDIEYIKQVVLTSNFYNSLGECIYDEDACKDKIYSFIDSKVLSRPYKFKQPKLKSKTILYFKHIDPSKNPDSIFTELIFKRTSKHRVK